MNNRSIRRWALLGALTSVALLAPACERKMPKEGSSYEGVVNEAQKNEQLPGTQQPATGGSGLQGQENEQPIGAPGDVTPRESSEVSPFGREEPHPGKTERGGADKAGEAEREPHPPGQ